MGDRLNAEDILYPGTDRTSQNGEFRFTFQEDGNLVLYKNGEAIWATGTNTDNSANHQVLMQADGNLVMYDANGQGIWQSGTSGLSNAYLLIQDDGNVCLYSNDQEGCFWNTGTN